MFKWLLGFAAAGLLGSIAGAAWYPPAANWSFGITLGALVGLFLLPLSPRGINGGGAFGPWLILVLIFSADPRWNDTHALLLSYAISCTLIWLVGILVVPDVEKADPFK